MTEILHVQSSVLSHPKASNETESARNAAQKLEATFLAEMLKAAGFGEQDNTFSGGAGEDQFSSFHRQAIAEKIATSGGVGLAEHIFRSIMELENDR